MEQKIPWMNRLSPRGRYEYAHDEILKKIPFPPQRITWTELTTALKEDRKTSFSEPTVSTHLKELIKEKLIVKEKKVNNRGGYSRIEGAKIEKTLVNLKEKIGEARLLIINENIKNLQIKPLVIRDKNDLKIITKKDEDMEGHIYEMIKDCFIELYQLYCKTFDLPTENKNGELLHIIVGDWKFYVSYQHEDFPLSH